MRGEGCHKASQRCAISARTSRMKKAGIRHREQMSQAEAGYVEARIPERVVLVRSWKANQGQILQVFTVVLRNLDSIPWYPSEVNTKMIRLQEGS